MEHREKALARRHVAHHEAWSEHAKKLPPLTIGDKVFIQNQVGNQPRRWERTGTVVELKDHDQYNVRVDGTGRLTLRNRRFLRSLSPIVRTQPTLTDLPPTTLSTPTPPTQGTSSPPSTRSPLSTPRQPALPTPTVPVPVHYPAPPMNQYTTRYSTPEPVQECFPPAPLPLGHSPMTPSRPVQQQCVEADYDEQVPPMTTPTLPPPPAAARQQPPPTPPPALGTPSQTSPAPRPQRIKKPSSLLNRDVWDLSSLVEDTPTLTSKQVMELFRFLASKVVVED